MPKIGSIGIPELLIILVVVLLIFGPRRLPDMAKGLGQSVREFRKGLRDMRKEFDDESNDGDGKANGSAAVSAAATNASVAAPSAGAAPAAGAGQSPSTVAAGEAAPADGTRRVGNGEIGSDHAVDSPAVDPDRKA